MQTDCSLYLVRHGESVFNRDHIITGHADSPLTKKGKTQARETQNLLKDIHFDAAYSSDLQRALKTGEIIFGKPIPPSHQLFDLRERTFGRLEGQSSQDEWFKLNRAYENKYAQLPFEQRWGFDYAEFIENDKALYVRFEKALKSIAQKHRNETVLVATHGGNIRVILMKLGFAPFVSAGAFANAGYVVLTFNGSEFNIKQVVGYNQKLSTSE